MQQKNFNSNPWGPAPKINVPFLKIQKSAATKKPSKKTAKKIKIKNAKKNKKIKTADSRQP
jgi:hypothetical protein